MELWSRFFQKGVNNMAFHIAGTTALVTGANRGIGRAIVEALLARGAAKVYATARKPEALADLVAASGGRVVPLTLDIRRPEEVRAAAAAAGDVRLLINNAGVVAKFDGPLTDPAWQTAARDEFEVNVLGLLSVTQAFAPVLARHGGGAILNLGSVASLVSFPILTTYSASKAAAHSLTQATRMMLAPQNTFVAGVYPGPIDTEMARDIQLEKASPASAALAILDGLEAGDEEIFPDPMSQQAGELFLRSPKALERQVAAPQGVAA
jgi:NAD(P)-dependent dehydrogenase (short-subunit alcohol dehydrogenase family)